MICKHPECSELKKIMNIREINGIRVTINTCSRETCKQWALRYLDRIERDGADAKMLANRKQKQ